MESLGTPERVALAVIAAIRWLARLLRGRVVEFVGGPARARVIGLFGAVLALNSAQIATVGAVAPQLEHALRIGNTKIGLLNSVSLLVAAVAVVPVGMLVDRVRRIPMLAGSIVLWSVTTLLAAFAHSYPTLLLTRAGLGAVAATAGPAIASLTGDYFPSRERGRVYGYILSGEIAGTAAGFIVSGTVASAISWRAAFVVLAIPGFFLARALLRTIPEPRRGGQSRLEPGTQDLEAALADVHRQADAATSEEQFIRDHDLAGAAARQRGLLPDPALVLETDPNRMTVDEAVRYILRIPTNTLLIMGSSLGYFFFAGLETFAVVFVRGHYHASQATATLVLGVLVLGALLGTLASGPLTDAFVRRGWLQARVVVPGICYMGAALVLIPGLLNGRLGTSIWFFTAGAALISAANPPLDAARLDVVPAGLWGRAESTRTFLRSLAQAAAPLIFGAVADIITGFVPQQAPIGTHVHRPVSSAAGTGLEVAFLIMLSSLVAAGVLLLQTRTSYPQDVATASAAWTHPAPASAPSVASDTSPIVEAPAPPGEPS